MDSWDHKVSLNLHDRAPLFLVVSISGYSFHSEGDRGGGGGGESNGLWREL